MKYALAIVVLALVAVGSYGLSCLKCGTYNCVPESELNCAAGIVPVPTTCGCCKTCAKSENEKCGGIYNMNGICSEKHQLRCEPNKENWQLAGKCVKA